MRVKVHFTGLLRHYAGEKEKEYQLEEGATFGDLLLAVGREFGPRLPENMWDARAERLHPLIRAGRKGAPFPEDEEPLRDGDEVFIISRMAGG